MTVSASTCLVSFVLEVRTLLAFRRLSQKHKRKHREDFRLLSKPTWQLATLNQYLSLGRSRLRRAAPGGDLLWNVLHCRRCVPDGRNVRSRLLPVCNGHSLAWRIGVSAADQVRPSEAYVFSTLELQLHVAAKVLALLPRRHTPCSERSQRFSHKISTPVTVVTEALDEGSAAPRSTISFEILLIPFDLQLNA